MLQTVHCGTTSHAYGRKKQRLDVGFSNAPTYHVMGNLVGVLGAWHGSGHDASQSGAQCISLVDGSPGGFSQHLHSSANHFSEVVKCGQSHVGNF